MNEGQRITNKGEREGEQDEEIWKNERK